jgi:hypothetical protein
MMIVITHHAGVGKRTYVPPKNCSVLIAHNVQFGTIILGNRVLHGFPLRSVYGTIHCSLARKLLRVRISAF